MTDTGPHSDPRLSEFGNDRVAELGEKDGHDRRKRWGDQIRYYVVLLLSFAQLAAGLGVVIGIGLLLTTQSLEHARGIAVNGVSAFVAHTAVQYLETGWWWAEE